MNEKDQQYLAQQIRTQYTETEKTHTKLDELKALDKKVKNPAAAFAYVLGTIGALVMGTGMSLCMDVIEPGTYFGFTIEENMMAQGIVIGLIGIFIAAVTYPIYKKMLATRRKKYADKIIELSDSIIKG